MTDGTMTRQIVADVLGPLDGLRLREVDLGEPAPDQVRIDVDAAGVGFVDGLVVQGLYQVRPEVPFVPGNALGGVVTAVGGAVRDLRPGDRVATLNPLTGAFASRALARASDVVVVPDAISLRQAAAAIEPWGTMLFAVTHRVSIRSGSRVLVLGAGGGIGSAGVGIAASLGAEVIAAASSRHKLEVAGAAGAAHLVDYATSDLREAVRSIAPGGVDYVIDPVGGSLAEEALRCLAPSGVHLVVGFASGDIPRFGANRILIGNHSVVGVDFGDAARRDPELARVVSSELFALIAEGRIAPPQPQAFPLEAAAEVLTGIASRSVAGKLVLVPGTVEDGAGGRR